MNIFSKGNNQSINMSNGSVSVNGKTINVPNGANVSVINGQVYVDGKLQDDFSDNQINLIINGDINNLTTDCSVTCKTVNGDIKAGSYVKCDNVGGNVNSGSYVKADVIKGSAKAGSYIKYNEK